MLSERCRRGHVSQCTESGERRKKSPRRLVRSHICVLADFQNVQPTRYHTISSETQKYGQACVWFCYSRVFPENLLCKTCLRAARECRLIRRHVDKQAGVFHSTASVVNSSRSVCEEWAGPRDHMLSRHVESECCGTRETELQRPETHT